MDSYDTKGGRGTYQVYHAYHPNYGEGPHPAWPEAFELVAEVDTWRLSGAYGLTNHLDGDWRENPEVRLVSRGMRSTSVGDVVVAPDGLVYRCEAVDWSLIKK